MLLKSSDLTRNQRHVKLASKRKGHECVSESWSGSEIEKLSLKKKDLKYTNKSEFVR